MTMRTKFWGTVGKVALKGAEDSFKVLPPYVPAEPVGLVPLDKAWGIPGTSVLIANDLPASVLPFSEKIKQNIIHILLEIGRAHV